MTDIIKEMDSVIGDAIKKEGMPLEILQLAINIENMIGEQYSDLSRKVQNPSGKSIFEYLAKEAAEEAKVLQTQHDALKEGKWLDDEDAKPLKNVCPAVKPDKDIKDSQDIAPSDSDIGRDESDLEALELAMEVKKRSIKFYCEASGKVKEEKAKKMFAHLIELEEKHLEELNVQYHWLKQTGFWYNPDMMTD
jgi:rubrerythrin